MSAPDKSYLPQDERKLQLLEAGIGLFGSRSYEEISIGEIAGAAGVSKGLIYHYFDGKRGYYNAAVELASRRLAETVEPDPELGGPENLRRGLHAYFDYVEDHADAYQTLLHGGLGVDDSVAELLEEIRADIAAGIIADIGVEETPPLRMAVRSWIGAVEGAAVDWLDYRDVDREEIIEVLAMSLVAKLGVVLGADELAETFDGSWIDQLGGRAPC